MRSVLEGRECAKNELGVGLVGFGSDSGSIATAQKFRLEIDVRWRKRTFRTPLSILSLTALSLSIVWQSLGSRNVPIPHSD